MTPQEYRDAILSSENEINEQLERDKQTLLCWYQAKNRTFVRIPGLIAFTREYRELEDAARLRMAREADAIEQRFYDQRCENSQFCEYCDNLENV